MPGTPSPPPPDPRARQEKGKKQGHHHHDLGADGGSGGSGSGGDSASNPVIQRERGRKKSRGRGTPSPSPVLPRAGRGSSSSSSSVLPPAGRGDGGGHSSSSSSVLPLAGRGDGGGHSSSSAGGDGGHSSSSVLPPAGREGVNTGDLGADNLSKPDHSYSSSYSKKKDREAKKKLHQEMRQRVMLTLFNTPELIRDVKTKTGLEPDPGKLLDSTRFRDAWITFNSLKDPGAKKVTALRQLAVDIMSKGKKGHHQASPLPTSKSSDRHTKGDGKKRKDRSLSTERGHSSSGLTPGAKAAKVNTPTARPESSSTLVSQAEAQEANNDGVIQGEHDEPALEEFAEDMRAALPTYAQNAKGEKKTDYPHILYVHLGNDERKTMPKDVWNLFFEKVQAICLERAFKDDAASPKIEWSGFSRGVGVIAPADEESKTIMKEVVSSITVAEHNFRAWARGERGKFIPLSILIPHTMKKEVFTAGKIMQAIVRTNKLHEDKHVIRSCNEFPGGGKRRLLRIGAEEDLVTAIKALNGVVYIAASKLEVFFRGGRLTSSTDTSSGSS